MRKIKLKFEEIEARKNIRVIHMAIFYLKKDLNGFQNWLFCKISVFDQTVLLEPLSDPISAASFQAI